MRRGILVLAAVAAIWATVSWMRPEATPTRVAVVSRSDPSLPANMLPAVVRESTVDPPPTAAGPAAPPVVQATASQSSTVIETDGGRSVTIVNSGSAVASTGGNTVIGSDQPGGHATVVNGPVTAVGNSSDVRVISRP